LLTRSRLGDQSSEATCGTAKPEKTDGSASAKLPFAQGIQRTIDWFDADPRRKVIDEGANAVWDKLIAAYESGLDQARSLFLP